jgi:uncharacterized membrane protein
MSARSKPRLSQQAATVSQGSNPLPRKGEGGRRSDREGSLSRLDSLAIPLLILLIAAFTAVCTLLNWYRMRALRQGFDVLVYEQPIWNTVHGRPFAQSMYSFAPTHLGVDLALFELWIAPFYALWQAPMTLFFLVSLGAGLGAWPLFLIARAQFSSSLAGLGWAALYLLYLPVGTIALSEFQPRLFSASALLGAYWFYRRERAVAFWLCLLLAITVRSDVGLVVGCFGLFALSERRPVAFGLAPALFGFGYWVAAVFLIIPALADGHGFLWQVNYAWLGADTRAIVTTVVTDPLYTARGVFTLEKGRYLAQLLWPLAFLPLLRPRVLLIPAPILALNLLSGEQVQFDLFHQYQALIIPFLFVAAIHGLGDLCAAEGAARLRRIAVLGVAASAAAVLLLPFWANNDNSRNGLHPSIAPLVPLIIVAFVAAPPLIALFLRRYAAPEAVPLVVVGLAALMALQHLGLGSEILRFAKNPGPDPRLATAQALIARIPADAPLAVTSQLGIHVPMRQQLYFFPGNSSYDPALVERARYVLADRLRDNRRENGYIEALLSTGRWRILAEADNFVLIEAAP